MSDSELAPKTPAKKKRDAESDDEPALDDDTAKKKKKKKPETEPDVNSDGEEVPKKRRKSSKVPKTQAEKDKEKRMQDRARKKLSGYRRLAVRAGYNDKEGRNSSQGYDATMSLLSSADAKRLLRFFPEVLNKSSYGVEECHERMLLCEEAVPKSAARTAQAHLEVIFRWAMNQALLNAVESGRRRVDAEHMYQALRRLDPSLKYTAILPAKGLIKHALNTAVFEDMKATEEDTKGEADDKKQNAKIAQKLAKHKAAIKLQKEQEKQDREADKNKEKEGAEMQAVAA